VADFLLSLLPRGTSVSTSNLALAPLLVTVAIFVLVAVVATRTTAYAAARRPAVSSTPTIITNAQEIRP